MLLLTAAVTAFDGSSTGEYDTTGTIGYIVIPSQKRNVAFPPKRHLCNCFVGTTLGQIAGSIQGSVDTVSPWRSPHLPPEGHVAAFRALHGVTSRIHHSLDLDVTLRAITEGIVGGAGFRAAAMNIVREDGCTEVVSVAGNDDARRALMGSIQTAAFWKRMTDASRPRGRLRFIDGRTDPDVTKGIGGVWTSPEPHLDAEDAWQPMDFLFAPLIGSAAQWLGMLAVDLPVNGYRPGPEQCEVLELFADHAALAIEHAQLHEEIRRKEADARYAATHDPLTGLFNRARLMQEFERGVLSESTAVIVVDLDGFKAVNDSFGHLVGDELLQSVANRLLHAVRSDDTVIRMGGDEFVIVLNGPAATFRNEALAEHIVGAIGEPFLLRVGQYTVGASVGTAYTDGDETMDVLLARADEELYRRKRSRWP